MIFWSILALILIAGTILFSQVILGDIILLAFFSLIMAWLYLLMNAADVAITEAAVNAVLGTIFTLIALQKNKEQLLSSPQNTKLALIVGLFALIVILPVIGHFPTFGDISSPVNNEITAYYITNTVEKLGFTNIVTGVLASFRGFDTLIETIVIFTAANAVYMLVGQDDE